MLPCAPYTIEWIIIINYEWDKLNWYIGGWSPIGSTRHCGHQYAYCANSGWLWWWRNWWNDDWQGKPKYSEKTCPSAALSITNPTCCPDANPVLRGGKPATNRLSYGTAMNGVRWRRKWSWTYYTIIMLYDGYCIRCSWYRWCFGNWSTPFFRLFIS
jgi:hypothetical protein